MWSASWLLSELEMVRAFRSCASGVRNKRGSEAEVESAQGAAVLDAGATVTDKRTRPFLRKRRLDEVCCERFPQYSRNVIQSWILQGKVLVDGHPVTKAGAQVKEDRNIILNAEQPKFVCRAGYKLEGALDHFQIDVTGKVALDSGLSTGGFTDLLLQRGATKVYGVDVGYGQVAEKIRQDERVVIMERTNLRYLEGLPEPVDLVTLDLSFISILLVMPAVVACMKPESMLITLIKPQFEAGRSQVGSGGIVRDPAVHQDVLCRIIAGVKAFGFECIGHIQSPIKGTEGNVEFLGVFRRQCPPHSGILQEAADAGVAKAPVKLRDDRTQG
ncbi:hypothetical protein KFL_001600150 [Klebsormidium nitens]|uniref:RNA-binding S4 domain-containing protein n=1 Tax=Klebsormidium nitens TaxID=105231 RepID=A0A1Y1HYN8_KLENI|nr:hypothetical protein KFL_001600150 [Klebsormidium nitens]|eukprot:GAQ83745.1 hypothetical protein KFL_001600150 [Klebsormidium nitens]